MKKNQASLKKIFRPRFLIYWLLLAGLWLLVQLPWRGRLCVGRYLGRLALCIARRRQQIVRKNLALVFPELTPNEQEALYRQCAENVGIGIIESGMAWFYSEARLRQMVRLEADAAAWSLIENHDVGTVLVSVHSTLMELGVRLLGLQLDAAGMYRPLTNPFFEEWMKYQRARAATQLVHFKEMRQVLRLLRQGENLWYALDQDMGKRVSVFTPFFGISCCSVNILPQLKKHTGARWIPVFVWRDDEKREYVVRILPEIVAQAGDSDTIVMQRVNAIFEEEIRRYPAQYFWLHRRFKTRPEGQQTFY